jgi:cell division protease FtsH
VTDKKDNKSFFDKVVETLKSHKYVVLIGIIALVVLGNYLYKDWKDKSVEIPLSEAITLSKDGIFKDLIIEHKNGVSTLVFKVVDGTDITTKDVADDPVKITKDTKVLVDVGYSDLNSLIDLGLVLPDDYKSNTTSGGINWGSWLYLLALVGLFWFILGGKMFFGNNAEKFKKEDNSITFADIGGISEVKESLMELVSFLKDKDYYSNLGAKIPRGVLLEGSPGVGKTMLARAIANEADVPFYYTTGSEFHSMWVGVSGQKVKKLFKQASKDACVIFIDEFDSLAHNRGNSNTDVGREWNHTLNQLLAEMDGFSKQNAKVIVIAATNRADVLDPAVLRAGRFDRKITVPLPSYKDRLEIVKIHAKNKPLANDVNYESLARQTSGFSGADIALLLNEAAILAGKDHQNKISMKHISTAIDKVLAGDERKGLTLTTEEKRLIAYHEAGHALVASKLKYADKVQRISILPRGNAGGFTRTASDKELVVLSKEKAMAMISVFLGGRVAEELVLNTVTSSAQNDLQRANELAKQMVEHFGMSEHFGLGYVSTSLMGIKDLSQNTQQVIENDINSILNSCYTEAKIVVSESKELLEKLANALLENETLDEVQFNKLMG